MFVLVFVAWQHFDELRRLVVDEPLDFVAIDPCWHQSSLKMSPKTVRPTAIASEIEIVNPVSSGLLVRYRCAISADSKKLSTSQQLVGCVKSVRPANPRSSPTRSNLRTSHG